MVNKKIKEERKMKEKGKMKKILLATALITAGLVTIGGNTSKAALQANSTTHANPIKKSGAYWIEEIRKMETSGQTMGLTETLGTDLTSSSESNNIDVHMIRTTEYGAMAILSASGFGNPKKLSEVTTKTTTGNVTGVYINTSYYEWTAGVAAANTVGKNARYYDLYTTSNSSAKVGDALGTATATNPGCAGWHGASNSGWVSGTNGFVRGYGGVFSFGSSTWTGNTGMGRGVAVVGTGL